MIEVLRPGLQTTVQDRGRSGYQAFGVPVCGSMDQVSLTLANILAGNDWREAALEFCGMGPTLRFDQDVVFALAGADFSAALNGIPLPANGAFFARKGDLLEMGTCREGFRAYFAVAGGFDLPEVMESRSTCLSACFGGFQGRALKAGDQIFFRSPQLWARGLAYRQIERTVCSDRPVRVVLGPQDHAFSPEGLDTFFSSEYRLTAQCDRMGCRLEGPRITLRDGITPNIISDGVVMGSIQVPNGQPIVMMADRQTTGGYVKLGAVITADLPLMAQKRPGDSVRFICVTMEEAHDAYRLMLRKLRNLQLDMNREDLW